MLEREGRLPTSPIGGRGLKEVLGPDRTRRLRGTFVFSPEVFPPSPGGGQGAAEAPLGIDTLACAGSGWLLTFRVNLVSG